MRLSLSLSLILGLSTSCALQGLQNKNHADRETEADTTRTSDELSEDAQRPFQALLTQSSNVRRVELWQPTGSTSLWTPKGDAVFYAGRGALIHFDTKTVQFVTKNTMDARVLSESHRLSEEEWARWLEKFAALNRVEKNEITRNCSANLLEGQTHLTIQFSDATRMEVLNYRTASCKADYVDTLSFERLFDWLSLNGAPWLD